ncbi:MAG TPA: hypothetical protein PK629_07820 [Oscillospiraceae bacterium]|nr:hypothetical protein [Oscillospiraceae bacterium]HPF56138.1 hypothetical protein [Clostridiales bacterium]HPK35404.1 hypothetical protein [Oscillospiraceae bacterium]HPR75303.1 hypothetical protein [Oscillospiraceae bacterium]
MMCGFKSKWKNVPKPLQITVYVILGVLGVAAMGVLFGFIIMWLWNWLMPAIFNLGEITYWQAIGIFILAKLIFGFGSSSSESKSHKEKKNHSDDRGSHWSEYDAWWETEGKKSFEKYTAEKETPDPDNV